MSGRPQADRGTQFAAYHRCMASIGENERRIAALEMNTELLAGGQAAILDLLRQQGRELAAHTLTLAEIDARFDQVDARFNQVDARFNQVDARFNQVDARFDQVDARFERMDATLADHGGKLEMMVAWIQRQPD